MPRPCFIIMPFSATASCTAPEWTRIFTTLFKPAVENAGFDYECRRSVATRGSIVGGIVRDLYDAHVVIADLTDQNANVFYELGVRHALNDRTILLAQERDDIPSDLRGYANHVYGWRKQPQRALFRQRITEILAEIEEKPDRPDNPVSDFLRHMHLAVSERRVTPVASLSLSDSELDSWAPLSSGEQIHLYRVRASNLQPASEATRVTVRLAETRPPLPALGFPLHETHDYARPFKRERPLRFSESFQLDVLAKSKTTHQLYFFRADLPGESYAQALSEDQMNAVLPALTNQNDGLKLRIEAVADPPAMPASQWYKAFVSHSGEFEVASCAPPGDQPGRQNSELPAVEVGEVVYIGPLPMQDEYPVSGVIVWIAVRNPGNVMNTVASIRLEAPGRGSIYQAEHERTKGGGDILVPPHGGFVSVPRKEAWLEVPAAIEAGGVVAGWIGFCFAETIPPINFLEARKWTARMVVTLARGEPADTTFPVCAPAAQA